MNEELKVIISAEIEKFKQNVNNAKKSIKDFVSENESSIREANDTWKSVGDASKKALGITATAIAGTVTALLALTASTAEYRQNQAKLNTSFTEAGYSADVAKTAYNDLYRVLGDDGQATEAAQHLSLLGLTTEELGGLTYSLQGVYAQFGDSLPIEGLTEAINHTAQLGEVQGPLADALEWVGITTDEFNEKLAKCDDETERARLIASTLSGEYDGLAASYEETNAEVLAQNDAQAKLNETMATVGEAMAPINTALTTLMNDILVQLTPYITQFAEDYMPQIQEALEGVGDKIGKVITWIADNWGLISTIAAVVLGIAAALAVVSTVMTVVNAVMLASHVNWIVLGIVAAIAALVAIIVICVKHWDEIKAKVSEVVENIKETVAGWVENLKTKFEEMKTNISEKVEAAKAAVVNKFNEIKTNISNAVQNAKQAVVDRFNEIKSNITEKINAVKTNITTVFTNIKSTITEKITAAKTSVLSIFESIKSGITTKINNAKTTVNNAIEAIKGFFDFEWSLPSIKLPHFSISGSFSLNPPSIPKFSVSWYEMGGVFDNPTLFPYGNGSVGGLGENGAEAIVPLEKNTKWLERMAGMVAERQGKTPIILNVDGKTFAQTSIDSINALTRQTGKLTLNLV